MIDNNLVTLIGLALLFGFGFFAMRKLGKDHSEIRRDEIKRMYDI